MSLSSVINNIINRVKRLLGIRAEEPLLRLREVLGFEPNNLDLYELAFTHSSCQKVDEQGNRLNNERLEFLGDSVLATAVSQHLYMQHPHWNEGELSKRRGALVKRAVNNAVAKRMGLHKMLRHSHDASRSISPDTYGNTLEALIGAVFLDRGYQGAEAFVLSRVLPLFQELEQSLVEQTTNYKSLLLEWVQRHHLEVDFLMLQEPKRSGGSFLCAIHIDGKRVSTGRGMNKKEAHQEAAHAALKALSSVDPSIPVSEG